MNKDTLERINVLAHQDELSEKEVEELNKLNLEAAKDAAKSAGALALKAAKEEADKEAAEKQAEAIKEAVKAEADKWAAKSRRLPSGEAPYAAKFSDTWKYDNLDLVDLSLFVDMQNAFKAKGIRYADGNEIKIDPAAMKSMAQRVADLKDDNSEEGRKEVAYVKGSFKAATGIEPTKEAVDAVLKGAVKTEGDPVYTGGSLAGSDWVGTAYSPELWRKIRANTNVVGKIPSEVIPDGYSNKTWPLESTDMTWYKVPEVSAGDATLHIPAATVASSKLATAKQNITIAKVGARGVYSGEMEEDSLIRFSSQARAQLEVSGQEMLESLVIDGDTETSSSTNINYINGDPAVTAYYLAFNGFRKLPLVTETTNSLSASGTLAIEDFLKIMRLMGTAGIGGADPSKVNFIYDGNVHYALAQLPEVKTKDVNSAATVENGFVTRLWGVEGIPSWQMHSLSAKRMANTAGKINGTDSSNTTGSALCVRWDQWKLAYKRRMTMEVTRIANADAWEIVALCRLGLGYRDAEASAILYNIGV
jgi:hypothetical protein